MKILGNQDLGAFNDGTVFMISAGCQYYVLAALVRTSPCKDQPAATHDCIDRPPAERAGDHRRDRRGEEA